MARKHPAVSVLAVFVLALVWGAGAFCTCFSLGGTAHAAPAGFQAAVHAHAQAGHDHGHNHGHKAAVLAAEAHDGGHELAECCDYAEAAAPAPVPKPVTVSSPFEKSPALAVLPMAAPVPAAARLQAHTHAQTGPPAAGATPVGLHNLLLI